MPARLLSSRWLSIIGAVRESGRTAAKTPLAAVFAGRESEMPLAFQEQFLATPDREYDVILEGHTHRIWHRPAWLWPLFQFLGLLGILVPRTGRNVPTTLAVLPGTLPNGEPYHELNLKGKDPNWKGVRRI